MKQAAAEGRHADAIKHATDAKKSHYEAMMSHRGAAREFSGLEGSAMQKLRVQHHGAATAHEEAHRMYSAVLGG